MAVHEGHLEFVFEVGNGAESADEGGGFMLGGEIHEEAFERGGGDVGPGGEVFLDQAESLGGVEERLFILVERDAYDHFVEEAGGARHDIEVAVGHGVEGAGINTDCHSRLKPDFLLRIKN